MAQEFAKTFYNSKKWRTARKAYISKRLLVDGGLCERCHSDIGYIVHHKEYITPKNIDDASITLNENNFEYVCKSCHDEIHEAEYRGQEYNIKFDDDGQLIPYPPKNKVGG